VVWLNAMFIPYHKTITTLIDTPTLRGVNVQRLFAPKLNLYGTLDPEKATESELRGQALFFGKADCARCHPAPYYTDNTMWNLKVERFYKPQKYNGKMAVADGPTKTFPLRGIKDSPPYYHDGRLLTLDDTVEFFNLILSLKLNEQEKKDITAFLRCL